ncbi:hypothetical protein ACWCQN_39080 [Streptomyces sp. NPDC001984]
MLLRQLLRDHLDLRALREESAAKVRRPEVIGPDRLPRTHLEKDHHRQPATLFGTVVVRRCAWRRPRVVNAYPADAALSLRSSGRDCGGAPQSMVDPLVIRLLTGNSRPALTRLSLVPPA